PCAIGKRTEVRTPACLRYGSAVPGRRTAGVPGRGGVRDSKLVFDGRFADNRGMYYSKPLARLVAELEKLPGIGPKSAQRLAFYLMRLPAEEARLLASAIVQVKEQMRSCSVCFNFTDQEVCEICSNARRDRTLLCVVADPRDLIAIERTNEFR